MVTRVPASAGYHPSSGRHRAFAAALTLGVYLFFLALLRWWPEHIDVRPVEPPTTFEALPVPPPPEPVAPPPLQPPPPPVPSLARSSPSAAGPEKQQQAPTDRRPAPALPAPVPAPPIFDVTPVKSAPAVTISGGDGGAGRADAGAPGNGAGSGGGGSGGSGDSGATIVRAQWVELLGWADIHRYHPAAALAKGLSGQAIIICAVRRTKRAYDCAVRSEEPSGEGFGAAALAMQRLYRIEPRRIDGKTIDDGRVVFTVHFYATAAEARSAAAVKQ